MPEVDYITLQQAIIAIGKRELRGNLPFTIWQYMFVSADYVDAEDRIWAKVDDEAKITEMRIETAFHADAPIAIHTPPRYYDPVLRPLLIMREVR
jgi:hypothetical protein